MKEEKTTGLQEIEPIKLINKTCRRYNTQVICCTNIFKWIKKVQIFNQFLSLRLNHLEIPEQIWESGTFPPKGILGIFKLNNYYTLIGRYLVVYWSLSRSRYQNVLYLPTKGTIIMTTNETLNIPGNPEI